jgi:hypothetical membrane protein
VFFVLYAAGISPFIMEWIAVYGGLLWILLFSYNAMQGEKSAYSKSINSHKPIYSRGIALDYAKIRRLGGYCGIAAIVIYVLCTLAAAFQYPMQFNPFDNWISDLGSYEKNPSGALIYNIGSGIAGLLLMPFFISLMAWYKLAKKNRHLYLGAEIFGLISAFGMIMLAVFYEETSLHALWATVCFGSLVVVLVLANVALIRNQKFNKKIGYYGFLAALVGLIFFVRLVAMDSPPIILEWAAVYSGFLWVLLFSFKALH